jgi:hypothetical protein
MAKLDPRKRTTMTWPKKSLDSEVFVSFVVVRSASSVWEWEKMIVSLFTHVFTSQRQVIVFTAHVVVVVVLESTVSIVPLSTSCAPSSPLHCQFLCDGLPFFDSWIVKRYRWDLLTMVDAHGWYVTD